MCMKDVLIIKTTSLIPAETLKRLHDIFVEQVKTGVVIIPPYFEAELINVPEDVEIVIESAPEAEFLEKDFNLAKNTPHIMEN